MTFGLAFATLRDRWPSLAGAFVALALGAALAIGAGAVLVAAEDAVDSGPARYAAAPIVVTAPLGSAEERYRRRAAVGATLAARVAALPEVRRVVRDRAIVVRAHGVALTARPWSARLDTRLLSGRPPSARGEIVAGPDLSALAKVAPPRTGGAAPSTGSPPPRAGGATPEAPAAVSLVTPAGPRTVRVVGRVAEGVFFGDDEAARLAPRVEALAVWPRSAAPAVRKAVGERGVVLTGSRRALAEPNPARDALAGASVLLSLMGMTLAFVAVFVTASSFAFSVALRRRELGLLRAVGATPRQVRRLVMREAALVGLAGGGAGALLSLVTGPLLGRWIVAKGLAPESMAVRPQPSAIAAGAGFMFVVGLCGAWLAARRAARVRPAEALRDAAVDRGVMTISRWLFGLPSLGGAVALALLDVEAEPEAQLPLAFGTASLAIVGLGLLAPLLVPRLVALLVLPLRSAGGLLIRQHARAGVRRTASTAAPVLVAIGLTGALATMVNSLSASDAAATRARVDPAALVVTADGDLSTADVAALRAATAADEAASATTARAGASPRAPAPVLGATLEGDVRVRGVLLRAVGAEPAALPLMLRAPVLDGSLVPFDGIVLGELAAKQLGRKVGDRVGVRLPDGKLRTLRVIAVVADGFGSVGLYVPYDVLAGHVGDRAATAVYVRGDARAIGAVATRLGLRVTGGTVTRTVDDVTDSSNMNPLALVVILGVAVLYVAIALAATAVTGTVARADELALLRLAGATRRDVVRLVAAEALAVTLVGGLLGCAITALIVAGLQRGAASLQGPVAIALPWALLATLIAVFAAISVTASALAARHTMRPVVGSPS
ncbi:putative ABC transport system permease protein [Solirubrobacter pauli]|uniref:Putative ABC transport system permease protein n=1 Tax=Solirubrobacter pauli TaxID=166793 RepID=A0A660LHY5_9ACTN|nr:FtsX-like permease family protein [Solirubrobacter pauli]RKQ93996.1 putative ABC transport system permease protein [Solirubrobacter pauli]